MEEILKPQVRLYCILARKAQFAAVFRRGPSKRVQLVLWNTATDQFTEGQWFKGRIYERRCDLSPAGTRLIYFAASYKPPYFSWTAISKPPFLTALALWPKGDGWGGGGLFEKEGKILLNHRPDEMQLAKEFKLPRHFRIEPLGARPGWGEDSPIMDMRLTRDGWHIIHEGKMTERGMRSNLWLEFNPAIVWSKPHIKSRRYELEMQIKGIKQRDGPWYLIDYLVRDKESGSTFDLGRTDWADWCHSGDLLFAKEGKLFRVEFSDDAEIGALTTPKLLIDLTDRAFVEVPPTTEAQEW